MEDEGAVSADYPELAGEVARAGGWDAAGGGMERDPTMHEDGGWVHAWGGLRSHGDEL